DTYQLLNEAAAPDRVLSGYLVVRGNARQHVQGLEAFEGRGDVAHFLRTEIKHAGIRAGWRVLDRNPFHLQQRRLERDVEHDRTTRANAYRVRLGHVAHGRNSQDEGSFGQIEEVPAIGSRRGEIGRASCRERA